MLSNIKAVHSSYNILEPVLKVLGYQGEYDDIVKEMKIRKDLITPSDIAELYPIESSKTRAVLRLSEHLRVCIIHINIDIRTPIHDDDPPKSLNQESAIFFPGRPIIVLLESEDGYFALEYHGSSIKESIFFLDNPDTTNLINGLMLKYGKRKKIPEIPFDFLQIRDEDDLGQLSRLYSRYTDIRDKKLNTVLEPIALRTVGMFSPPELSKDVTYPVSSVVEQLLKDLNDKVDLSEISRIYSKTGVAGVAYAPKRDPLKSSIKKSVPYAKSLTHPSIQIFEHPGQELLEFAVRLKSSGLGVDAVNISDSESRQWYCFTVIYGAYHVIYHVNDGILLDTRRMSTFVHPSLGIELYRPRYSGFKSFKKFVKKHGLKKLYVVNKTVDDVYNDGIRYDKSLSTETVLYILNEHRTKVQYHSWRSKELRLKSHDPETYLPLYKEVHFRFREML